MYCTYWTPAEKMEIISIKILYREDSNCWINCSKNNKKKKDKIIIKLPTEFEIL